MSERLQKTYNVRSQLPSILLPTLVLHGRFDWIIPISESEEMAQKIPNAQLHIFEHAGHAVPHDSPDELIERIRKFLA